MSWSWHTNSQKSPAQPAIRKPAGNCDAVLELRGYVEKLQAVELPKGSGRD
jgi:hypothetical protein